MVVAWWGVEVDERVCLWCCGLFWWFVVVVCCGFLGLLRFVCCGCYFGFRWRCVFIEPSAGAFELA